MKKAHKISNGKKIIEKIIKIALILILFMRVINTIIIA